MKVSLTVVDGPHRGKTFSFADHDTFLVGRSKHAHFQLPAKDKYFSRVHFMIEVNPPECRLVDMGSHNGTYVNGERAVTVDLKDGDEIRAGHTVFQIHVVRDSDVYSETVSLDLQSPDIVAVRVPEIPGYERLEFGGTQPLGVSFLGFRTKDALPVSVSVVRPPHVPTEKHLREFLAQAATLKSLDHPRIRRLHDLGAGDKLLWFAYDEAPNTVRANRLGSSDPPLALRRVLGWTQELLTALEHAHAQGFVHRDIRPSGVLIAEQDDKETASWAEFGLARLLADAPFGGLTTFADPEAAAFWPPEFLTDYRHPTPLGDQYSLAATVYWMMTGQFMFDMPKEANRRYSTLLKQQVVPIRQRREDIPDRIALALEKALSRQPDNRYVDLAAFRVALLGK